MSENLELQLRLLHMKLDQIGERLQCFKQHTIYSFIIRDRQRDDGKHVTHVDWYEEIEINPNGTFFPQRKSFSQYLDYQWQIDDFEYWSGHSLDSVVRAESDVPLSRKAGKYNRFEVQVKAPFGVFTNMSVLSDDGKRSTVKPLANGFYWTDGSAANNVPEPVKTLNVHIAEAFESVDDDVAHSYNRVIETLVESNPEFFTDTNKAAVVVTWLYGDDNGNGYTFDYRSELEDQVIETTLFFASDVSDAIAAGHDEKKVKLTGKALAVRSMLDFLGVG